MVDDLDVPGPSAPGELGGRRSSRRRRSRAGATPPAARRRARRRSRLERGPLVEDRHQDRERVGLKLHGYTLRNGAPLPAQRRSSFRAGSRSCDAYGRPASPVRLAVRQVLSIARLHACDGRRPGGSRADDREGYTHAVLGMKLIFWGSLGGLAWTHAGYPVAAGIAARIRPRPAAQERRGRTVRDRHRPCVQRRGSDRAATGKPSLARLPRRTSLQHRHRVRRFERSDA